MRRVAAILLALCLTLTFLPVRVSAAQLALPVLSYKFYPLRDLVFVDFHNPYFTPVDNIVVNMVIREGTGRNRVIAIGQAFLPENLVLSPGEHVSTSVPIRARVVRDIPLLAEFEFRITGRPVEDGAAPPDVVVLESDNGVDLEFNLDPDGVPMVFGFIGLNPAITEETEVVVQAAILTFYDEDRQVVWSEFLPVYGRLQNNESLMIWGKFQRINKALVPEISSVDVKFVVAGAQ